MEGIQSIRNLHVVSDPQTQQMQQLQQQQQQQQRLPQDSSLLTQAIWFQYQQAQQQAAFQRHQSQQQQQQQQHQQQLQLQLQLQHQQQQHQHHQSQHHRLEIYQNHLNQNGHHNNTASNNHNQRHPKKELIDLITCKICKGYLIDATTIDLCMHTFCRPCAVDHVKKTLRCPECNIEIKDKRYLNRLKTDVNMQNIVYKLVPGLYEKEMARRRKFYEARPSPTTRYPSEMFGDIPPSKNIKPDDMLNVCLNFTTDSNSDEPLKIHLLLRADSTMLLLKKLMLAKFGLERQVKIYHGNSEIFFDLTTLMDVAATFNWRPEETKKILNLNIKEEEEKKEQINSLPLMNSGHGP